MTDDEVTERCKDAAPGDPCEGEIQQINATSGPGRSTGRCFKHQARHALARQATDAPGVGFYREER